MDSKEETEGEDRSSGIVPASSPIEDPWHSRPIDVHRWSDHRHVKELVNELWEQHFTDLNKISSTPGPKPRTNFKNQLMVLLLDLYVAWTEDPDLSIGIPMSGNHWATNSRYNALHISKQIIPLTNRLSALGMIDLARGSYSGPWARGNRTTRIRASAKLQKMFAGSELQRGMIRRIDTEECIVLKAGAETGENQKLVDYPDNDETNRMRAELRAYNRVLAEAFIDIPTLDQAVWEHTVTSGRDTGRVVRQPLDHHHHFVRRIFSRGSWALNGRFYGPWWQLIPSELRKQIYINDTPTVEVDFKGLHVAILSAERGIAPPEDPYVLPEGTIPGTPPSLQRAIIKQLVLIALNAPDRKSAFQSFRDGWPAGHLAKQMDGQTLGALLDLFARQHPHLADCLCADQGIRLMNVDGKIAERVHRHFTSRGIPVLSVHDSFIIDYTRVEELKKAMAAASLDVVGKVLATSQVGPGLDEMIKANPRDVVLDFAWWRQTPRCAGYLSRLSHWEELMGRQVTSYDQSK